MRILTEGTNLDGFFELVAGDSERLLILDYDGTLSPFRIERSEALPYPGVAPLIGSIMEAERSRVVIVSGRAVEDLQNLLDFTPIPELYGSHGWERTDTDGTLISLPIGAANLRGLEEALSFIEAKGLSSYSERKHGSIAFHWRGLSNDEIETLKERLHKGLLGIAERHGLHLLSFDGGMELRATGNDKGTAVRSLLDQVPAGSAVAYLGDDMTDEDAFRALEGRGLRVLVAPSLRATAADLWITPPDELLEFLGRWAESCRR